MNNSLVQVIKGQVMAVLAVKQNMLNCEQDISKFQSGKPECLLKHWLDEKSHPIIIHRKL